MTDSEHNELEEQGNGAADPDPSEQRSAPEASDPPAEAQAEADPLETSKAEAARYRDQLLRTAADFDNFRKRSRRDVSEAEQRAREDLLRDLLPVFDNLERAVQHSESTTDVQALADGIRMVMRQFVDTLGKLGIERVEAVGKPFDPAFHEAIQHLESTEHPPGTITHEVQPGYKLGERLLRPALVVVAKASSKPE